MRGWEYLRAAVRESARKSHPHGERREEAFPVRPEGTTDLDLRGNAKVRDQSKELLVGIDMTT